jgi:hypothetical protein
VPEFIEDPSVVHQYADGSARFGLKLLLDSDETDKARNGYLCFTQCGEDWTSSDLPAWATCPVCGSTENTPENFRRLYLGEHDTGSQVDWDNEEERLVRQRWERELAEGLRTKGIYIPEF